MVEENETRPAQDQVEGLEDKELVDEDRPQAELPAPQDETQPEAEVPAPEELPLEEAAALVDADEPLPSEMDLAQADQEVEVEARLGEGDLIEKTPPEKLEPVADRAPAQLEEKTVEAETPRRKPRSADLEERAARLSDEGGPDFSQVPQPDGESDGRAWYVVHCYSGYENKVRHNLEQRIESMGMKDKIFDVVVPTEEEIEVKEGKRRTVERRVFPGHILVKMIMTEESWYVVRNPPGVAGFVGMGNEPTALRPEEVAQIIRRMEAEAPRVKVTYKIDQKLTIIDE